MFIDLHAQTQHSTVNVIIDGVSMAVPASYSVAAALLSIGKNSNRKTAVGGQQRGPYCMMGVCFECLVEIDGMANRQACMTQVAQGMVICQQHHLDNHMDNDDGQTDAEHQHAH